MKFLKLFFVMAFCAIAFNMNAVTKATITITSDAHPDYYDCLEIEMDAAYAADFANSSKKFHSDMSGGTVELYAVGTTLDYCIIKMKDVNGVKLVFKANTLDDAYTMSFSNVTTGCPIQIKKGTDGTPFDMTANYQFSCTHATSCEFYLVTPQEKTYERQVAINAWGTICYPDSLTAITGATIYQLVAKNAAEPTKVAAEEVAVSALVPGKAYLFNATAAEQVFTYFPESAVAEAKPNKGLFGTFAAAGITLEAEKWVVKGNSIIPAAAGSTVPQYRAYVDLSDTNLPVDQSYFTTSAPGRKIFNVVGEATGFEAVEAAPAMNGKVMMNGRLVIIRDGKMFNAQGAAL